MAAGCALLCGRAAEGFAAGVLATLDCAAVGSGFRLTLPEGGCVRRTRTRHSKQRVSGDERGGQAQEAAGESDASHSGTESLQTKNAHDALGEWTAVRRHGEDGSAAPLFHQREGACVFNGVAAESHRDVIAAVFAFGADSLVQPPDCGMVEEQRLDADLEHVDKGIEALDVREFVGDDCLKLIFGEAGESTHWQEHDGTKPSDDRGRLQPRAFTVFNRSSQAELLLQVVTDFENLRAHDGGPFAAFPLEQHEASGGTEAEEGHAQQPGFDQPGKRIAGRGARRLDQALRRATRRDSAPREGLDGRGERRRRLRGVCHTGMLLRIEEECRDGSEQHQCQRAHSDQVTSRRAAADSHCGCGQCGECRSLPQEVEERPSQGLHRARGNPIHQSSRHPGSHRRLLSYSSSRWRSSTISSADALVPASACIINWLAEPSKTRCNMSPASCRLVCSAGRHAS